MTGSHYSRFTPKEDQIIRKEYHKTSPTLLGIKLNRSDASIRARAQKLGIVERKKQQHPRAARGTGLEVREKPVVVAVAEPPAALVRLAEFDPILARALVERLRG